MSVGARICPQCGSEYSAEIKFCPKDGSTLRVPPGAALIGAVIADRYHILKKLGEGGMGQVYLAEHVKMGRPSAIKIMAPGMMQDADAISRFNREAANASRINHPNVAAIYDFGETSDGLIYLAMEYIEGESLTGVIERGAISAARAASIVTQTAAALDAAHERGIVHRDLKPDNIMVARNRDGSDLVKVVDFGIAKAQGGAGQKVTKTGLVVGTPEYMSPEQLAGDAVDARSDLYALALVAFNMLTGTLPFAGGSAQETLIRRLTDKPRTLSEVRPGASWPPALERLIARSLDRDAAARPASAGAFAAEFAKAVAGLELDPEGKTAVLSAVPATRVDGGAGAPATRPSTRVTAPPKRRRGLLLAGGGVAVAAVVLALAARGGAKRAAQAPAVDAQPFSKPAAGLAPETTAAASAPAPAPPSPAVTKTGTNPAVKPATVPAPAPAPVPAPVPASDSSPAGAAGQRPGAPLVYVPKNVKPGPEAAAPNPTAAAVRARRAVDNAASLIERGESGRAILLLEEAFPYLTTHKDSMDAAYHLSEALLQRAEKDGEAAPRQRACSILLRMKRDPSGYLASSVNALYDNGGCK